MSPVEALVRFLASVLVAYLLGAIPTGVLVGKFFGNRDPRATGSGKTGATNVLRTLGPGPAAIVVVVDVAKSATAVLLARYVFFGGNSGLRDYAEALAGFAAIMGHNYSIYIRFGGGRGVLTGAGAMLIMSPFAMLIGFIFGVVPISLTRYVSLGSILGAAASAVTALALVLTHHDSLPHFLFILAGATIIILSHRDNIERLLSGTERKLGQPAV